MIRSMQWTKNALMVAGILTAGAMESRANLITLRSGNGAVGSTDSDITFLDGPGSSDFAALTPTDFANAQIGPHAFIISPAYWIPTLPSDSLAQWIATSPGAATQCSDTGLFAIHFYVNGPISSLTIDLHYAVDNVLGSNVNEGVFLNGTALSGDTTGGSFSTEYDITRTDLAPLAVVGLNTIYIDAVNQGGPAGLIFSAAISGEGISSSLAPAAAAVPEPATLVSLTIAGLMSAGYAYRRRYRRV